jgi:hypothetical protein
VKNLITFLLLVVTPSAIAQTTFHGNNARTGVFDSAGPKQLGAVKWTFKTEGAIIASPAIADGTVFIGSSDDGFYALDQETGKQKWKVMFTDPIASSPASGLFPGVRSRALRPGNRYGQDQVEVCDQRRKTFRGQRNSWIDAFRSNYRRPHGFIFVFAGGEQRACLFWKQRWTCLRCGCANRSPAVVVRNPGRRSRIASHREQYGLHWQLG